MTSTAKQSKARKGRKTGNQKGTQARQHIPGVPNDAETGQHGVEGRKNPSSTQESYALHEIPRSKVALVTKSGMLDAPPAQPGMTQRWVRVRIGRELDKRNLNMHIQAHWRPRLAETVPTDSSPPTIEFEGHTYIGVDDLLLMERPEKLDDIERSMNAQRINERMAAVREDLESAQQPGGPQIQVGHRTEVTRGKRRPAVKSDGMQDDLIDSDIEDGEVLD